jgi:hypothetical protein
VRDRDHGRHQRGVVGIASRVAHEGQVELQRVHREAAEVGERREAGAETVDREPHAERLQRAQRLDDLLGVVHRVAFGDLKAEARGRQARLLEGAGDLGRDSGLAQLVGREVHRHLERGVPRLLPGPHLRARRLEDPGSHGQDEAREVRQG